MMNMQPRLNIFHILIAFIITLMASVLLGLPVLIFTGFVEFNEPLGVFLSSASGYLGLFFLVLYSRMLPQEAKMSVYGQTANLFKELMIGALCCLIAFPLINVSLVLINSILHFLYAGPFYEQVAVTELKKMQESVSLLIFSLVNVIIVVPILEELLFRGYLQSWLSTMMSWQKSVFLTSLLFALMHLSEKQGINNIEIFTALFILSLLFGYLRYRRNTIWASIGLHMTFNAVNSFFILNL